MRWKQHDGDPVEALERREQRRIAHIAKAIYDRTPASQWDSRIALLPADQRKIVRECLTRLKEYEQSNR